MKAVIIFLICFFIVGCTNKSKQKEEKGSDILELSLDNQQDDTTTSKEFDKKKQTINLKNDNPITGYEFPGFWLMYSKELPDSVCCGKKYRVWTEKACYTRDVKTIKLFVENRTKKYWRFGRDWGLEVWNGSKWCTPKQKTVLGWFDDAFTIPKAPLLYCFQFPIADYFYLSTGRYQIKKAFDMNDGRNLFVELYAEFEIK